MVSPMAPLDLTLNDIERSNKFKVTEGLKPYMS